MPRAVQYHAYDWPELKQENEQQHSTTRSKYVWHQLGSAHCNHAQGTCSPERRCFACFRRHRHAQNVTASAHAARLAQVQTELIQTNLSSMDLCIDSHLTA